MRLSKKLRPLGKKNPPDAKRLGFKLKTSGIPREGCDIFSPTGELLGRVTSGGFSPTLRIGIGMAYLPTSKVAKEGSPIIVKIRNKDVEAVTSKMPFVETKYHRTK